jgi:hypothetical protein
MVKNNTNLAFVAINLTIRRVLIERKLCSPNAHALWHITFPNHIELSTINGGKQ